MPFIRYEIGDIGSINNLNKSRKKVISKLKEELMITLFTQWKNFTWFSFLLYIKSHSGKGGFSKNLLLNKNKTKVFN